MMQHLKENWFLLSKMTSGIWRILTRALENLKNLHFNGLLLNKVHNFWAKKSIGEFCLTVLNILMQNLQENWLVLSKMTWGILQILTWALENLKNLHFNGFLLNKVHNLWAKKSIGGFCLMALNIYPTFQGKMACAFKNGMRNFANFHRNPWKCQNWYSYGILLLKLENIWA